MPDHALENLGPERFQELCQALLVRDYPDVVCFPVGQPDGGRDAIRYIPRGSAGEAILYQVKYVRKPQAEKDLHKWLVNVVATEAPKVARLARRGVGRFVLLTNVGGTAHLDAGAIDQVQSILSDAFAIDAVCWWREDINRRLDSAWDLKWAYPDVMTGPDLLRALIEGGMNEDRARRTGAIRAFLRAQYVADSEVKFRQVELQNHLLDLFVDVPAVLRTGFAGRREKRLRGKYLVRRIAREAAAPADEPDAGEPFFIDEEPPVGAATLLLDSRAQVELPRVVVEGAPGQGKSTVAQYLCQVHRMRLLGEAGELERVPAAHRNIATRLPFKVDLRDLATWFERRNPFSGEAERLEDPGWEKSLETFLAAQVAFHSGGVAFDVSDLHAVLRASSALLVLDGLDEVADIAARQEVVREVERALARLDEISLSLQTVATSRPAAFANSPGFARRRFDYVDLDALTRPLIDDYADRWLRARRLPQREAAEVKRILTARLDQPHLRDLARNPMQLAILMSVIHTRGVSLPDKRTALYDDYVQIFFSREAEKSTIVRDHRDLLVDIHGYLGWRLHAAAEEGRYRRGIPTDDLKEVVRNYLETEGHDVALVDALFVGMVERVVALVSRVEGVFEFEVQPLREYFAARHLYETAPYSPPGREATGTKPDRFDALARDFYWLNVVRFFAGCFSKGELPSLVDRLEELSNQDGYRNTSHPRELAAVLLSDYVFTQHPRSTKSVVALLLDPLGLRRFLTVRAGERGERGSLSLPASSGRSELRARCVEILDAHPPLDFARALTDAARANGTASEVDALWRENLPQQASPARTRWMTYGLWLGSLARMDSEVLEQLWRASAPSVLELHAALEARQIELVEGNKERLDKVIESTLDTNVTPTLRRGPTASYAVAVATALDLNFYQFALGYGYGESLGAALRRSRGVELESLRPSARPPNELAAAAKRVFDVFAEESQRRMDDWVTSLEPWNRVVEAARGSWGDRWLLCTLATFAAGIRAKDETCTEASDLFDKERPLCRRARYARLRAGSVDWWTRTLSEARNDLERALCLLLLLRWGSPRTIAACAPAMEDCVERLSAVVFGQLRFAVRSLSGEFGPSFGRHSSTLTVQDLPPDLTARSACLLMARSNAKTRISLYGRYLRDYSGEDTEVLSACLDTERTLIARKENDWARLVELTRIVYARKHHVFFPQDARDDVRVPEALAFQITSEPEAYPVSLVALAERSCRENVLARVVPVAQVAAAEGWLGI